MRPSVDCARRDLIGRVPRRAIAHQRRRQSVARIAAAVANDAVELAQIVGLLPWSVAVLELERAEQRAAADGRRRRDQHAAERVVAAADPHHRTGERVRVVDVRGARRGEVSVLGEVRALRELHAARELGDQEVEIRVAVAVAVRRHVHRHARDRRREVGAVIEVEAAQVVPVGLALAAVLADDDARNGFEDFAGPHDWARLELACGDRALAGGLRDSDEILRRRGHVGEVGEGRLARHRDVGAEDEVQDRVHCLCVRSDRDRPPDRREVDEGERDLEPSGPQCRRFDTRRARWFASARPRHARPQFDQHAGSAAPVSSRTVPLRCACAEQPRRPAS